MDREELESWLKTRPREDVILIAQRAALRVFPVWASQMGQGWAREHNLTSGTLLRCYLTSGVALKYPTPEVRASASASARAASARAATTALVAPTASALAALSASASAATAATAAATTAALAATTAAESWARVDLDVALLTEGKDLLSVPLWQGNAPEQILRAEVEGLENLARETGDRNSFWHRWYFAAKRGEWLDWELQRDVALIPEGVWKQGPKAVMAAIAEIELARSITRTPIAEEVRRDEAGLFYVRPLSTIRPDLFRDAIEKVRDTMAELRASQRLANCRGWLMDDLARLDDHFARYPDHPLRIHDVFQKTLRHLDRLKAEGFLPDDNLLEDFRHDLDTGCVDIRRADTEVAKTVKARVGDRLSSLRSVQKAALGPVVEQAAAEARPQLASELREDHAKAADPQAETQDRDESSYRLTGRLLRMAKRRKDDAVKAADDVGKVARAAEGIGKAVEGSQGWWEWIIANLPQLFG